MDCYNRSSFNSWTPLFNGDERMNTAKLYANTRYDTTPLYKLKAGTRIHLFQATKSRTQYKKSPRRDVILYQGSEVTVLVQTSESSGQEVKIKDTGCVIVPKPRKKRVKK